MDIEPQAVGTDRISHHAPEPRADFGGRGFRRKLVSAAARNLHELPRIAKRVTVSPSRATVVKWVRFVIGLAILVAILWYVDFAKFFETFRELSPGYVVVMLLTAFAGRFLRAWKWNVLLRGNGISISTWQALRMSLVSHFTGAWTPGQIGGDAYRVYALREFGKSKEVLSTVLLERYAGLCGVCFFVLFGLPVTLPYLAKTSPWLAPILLLLVAGVVVVVPLLLSQRVTRTVTRCLPVLKNSKIGNKLAELYRTFLAYRHPRGTMTLFAVIALVEILSYFVLNYFCARAIGLDVSLVFFLFAMPIVHLILRIPISVQALGVQEGCFVLALAVAGFPVEEARASGVALSLVQRALEWFVAIAPGGLLMWLTSGPTPVQSNKLVE